MSHSLKLFFKKNILILLLLFISNKFITKPKLKTKVPSYSCLCLYKRQKYQLNPQIIKFKENVLDYDKTNNKIKK